MFAKKLMSASAVVGGGISSVDWRDSGFDNTSRTTYTFSNMDIGTADDNRYVVISASMSSTNNVETPTSVTIGGVSAKEIYSYGDESTVVYPMSIAYWAALVPTGTTADVVVTYSSSRYAASLSVWSIVGMTSTTPYDTASDVSSNQNLSTTISRTTESVVIATTYVVDSYSSSTISGGNVTWGSDLTEQFDYDTRTKEWFSGADTNILSAGDDLTVSVTFDEIPDRSNILVAVTLI